MPDQKATEPAASRPVEARPRPRPLDDNTAFSKPVSELSSESCDDAELRAAGQPTDAASKKKKKKKKPRKLKQTVLTGKTEDGAAAANDGPDATTTTKKALKCLKGLKGLTNAEVEDFLKLNPALANEINAGAAASSSGGGGSSGGESLVQSMKRLKMAEIMTGLATSGKNKKDMGSYKFWNTQPVPQFADGPQPQVKEGPFKVQKLEEVPTEPAPLALDKFRWVTMDLTDPGQMEEVYKLLCGHYVEDEEAMFRFNYSSSILKWALMSPGWKKEWHVGIRTGDTLCAFISAIPVEIRVREKVIRGSEVNFLCVHKKLRNRRLAPVLIKEITRLCNRDEVWQAIYTGGNILPRPISSCRYYHRAINWQKLYEVGFSPCPPRSTPALMKKRYALPDLTKTEGLVEMDETHVDQVHDLLTRYLKRFDLAPNLTRDEVEHWLLPKKPAEGEGQQVVWSYVVENPVTTEVTDFFSFYCLESSVINSVKYPVIRAAYLFYYATEVGMQTPLDRPALGQRLNELIADALVISKQYDFDVFNALSLLDNSLFLSQRLFGPGDGQLHYYLFNYATAPIFGGVDMHNNLDETRSSGVGFVML